jgi:phenylalanyl-tRNA synthetase beta chain
MKISWNWLNEYLTCESLTVDEASSILTSIGLEVEGIEKFESIKGGLENFFIGEVISCEKHPNADKLSLTQVDLGETLGTRKIVCGAPNVETGQKVAVAIEGAVIHLPNGESFTIKNSKIRGEESQGMICAEDELGIGSSHDGILVLKDGAKVGMSAADFFGINTDSVFEIGLTPNRTDAMCHRGVARDLAAAMNARGQKCEFHSEGKTTFKSSKSAFNRTLEIKINTDKAPKFGGCMIEGIEENATPSWMKDRLAAIGETSKNLLVDVTNYILHDLGQPLHAYDYSKLKGDTISIDELNTESTMIALSGIELKLKTGDIVIKDDEKIIGLAGIMGSHSSSIEGETKSIFLEGAYFNSSAIRQTSQRLKLRSEAAIKFEKGVDPNGTEAAIEKAKEIILSLSENAQASSINMISVQDFPFWQVNLTRAKLDMYANAVIEKEKVDFILTNLGIEILASNETSWTLSIPRFKEDVKREEDVIEEILRIYGFNLLPYPKFLRSNLSFSSGLSARQLEEQISSILTGHGFQEILTNSISQSKYYPDSSPIRLLNSMTSELDCMRSSIIPGFLEVIEYNSNRDQKDLALYEIGAEYFLDKSGKYHQRKRISIVCTGLFQNPSWQEAKGKANDYFQIKSVIEKLFKELKVEISYKETHNSNFNFGLALNIGQKEIGFLGELKWDKNMFDIKQKVFFADIDFNYLLQFKSKEKIQYKEVSKFPIVKRDLAIVVSESTPYSQIEAWTKKSLGSVLTTMTLFDIFKDKSLGEGKKSYAVRYFLNHPDKTLLDKEIDSMMQKLITGYQKEFSAEIRS